MAMATPCAGCSKVTSWICAAQYTHQDQHEIICFDCYENGVRCWFFEGKLVVSKDQPKGSKKAVLYWDEGGYVTGGGGAFTYPDKDQPE